MAQYHAENNANSWTLDGASDEQLERWGIDPDCIEKDICAAYLAERIAKRERNAAAQSITRAAKRKELQDNPFDPRTEVSADAKHIAGRIVKHLWILFVLLPFIIGVLLVVVGGIK